MKKISILGCGWLGMPLGEFLVDHDYTVNGSTTRSEKLYEIALRGMEAYQFDLDDERADFGDFFFSDVVIIAIPPSSSKQENGYQMQLERVKGLAEQAFVKNIILISSTSVYPDGNRMVSESDASFEALTRSGISLLEAEQILKSEHNTVIRFGGLFGGNRQPGRWFAGKKDLQGAISPVNMIHLEDCIHIIQRIIEGEHWGETFNACAGEHPSKKEYYKNMAERLGLEAPEYVDGETSWKIVSSDYLIEKMGYEFRRDVFGMMI
jgi:nucleoside-diphosphate-sugar epimerase